MRSLESLIAERPYLSAARTYCAAHHLGNSHPPSHIRFASRWVWCFRASVPSGLALFANHLPNGGNRLSRPQPRIMIYVQSLHGVGHMVRASRIAEGLTKFANVLLISAGRTVPDFAPPPSVAHLPLPGILRDPSDMTIRSEDLSVPFDQVLKNRSAILKQCILSSLADLLLIEYFPFQRWELATEILQVIETFKHANPRALICCSVRDFPKPPADARHTQLIAQTIDAYFDAIFVHGDPRVCGDWPCFLTCPAMKPPLRFTGYIAPAQGRIDADLLTAENSTNAQEAVLLSVGGGAGSYDILSAGVEAWHKLVMDGLVADRTMKVFVGPYVNASEFKSLRATVDRARNVSVLPFSDAFLPMLTRASLSISCAGYNTCVETLSANVRAVLIPSEDVSDQRPRASRLAAAGVGSVIFRERLTAENLMSAIMMELRKPRPSLEFALNGVDVTSLEIKQLLSA
jgi:predicted glycosyltransferase